MAGREFFQGRWLRMCGFTGPIRENSRTAKTKKDNERKLIYEKSK
jgi:hypothetical protein